MKQKIVQFIRSADNLEGIMETPFYLAKKLDLGVELFLVLEPQMMFTYPLSKSNDVLFGKMQHFNALSEQEKKAESIIRRFLKNNKTYSKIRSLSYSIKSGETDVLLGEKSKDQDTSLLLINESVEPENDFKMKSFHDLVKTSECPILKVPTNYGLKTLRKILYATDYKEEDIPTLKELSVMARAFNAEITALHITESIDLEEKMKSSRFEKVIQDKVGYNKIRLAIHPGESIDRAIIDYGKSSESNLIVALKENKGFFKRLFFGSSSQRIFRKSKLPVMVFSHNN